MKISENFWKNFKKNDIVIYAIALMLVVAGYFNYSTLESDTEETYSEDISNIAATDSNDLDDNDIGDAVLVSNNEVEEENSEETETETDNESQDEATESTEDVEDTEDENSSDYFVNSKLERETNYASMITTYTQILEDDSISETQKAIAMEEITEINNIKNAISICENLFSTKGFINSLVLVNDDSINVVVEIDEGLTTENVAQIQNIISREFDVEISNIHITENEE